MTNALEIIGNFISLAELRSIFGPTAVEVATITASIVLLAIALMTAGILLMSLITKITDGIRVRGIRRRMRGEA